MNEFLANHTDIQEEDETAEAERDEDDAPRQERRDSENYQLPTDLDDETKAKLLSCMDEIRGIIGDTTVTDKCLVETIMEFEYDCAKALDHLLNKPASISPTASAPLSNTKRPSNDAPIEKGKQKY